MSISSVQFNGSLVMISGVDVLEMYKSARKALMSRGADNNHPGSWQLAVELSTSTTCRYAIEDVREAMICDKRSEGNDCHEMIWRGTSPLGTVRASPADCERRSQRAPSAPVHKG